MSPPEVPPRTESLRGKRPQDLLWKLGECTTGAIERGSPGFQLQLMQRCPRFLSLELLRGTCGARVLVKRSLRHKLAIIVIQTCVVSRRSDVVSCEKEHLLSPIRAHFLDPSTPASLVSHLMPEGACLIMKISTRPTSWGRTLATWSQRHPGEAWRSWGRTWALQLQSIAPSRRISRIGRVSRDG